MNTLTSYHPIKTILNLLVLTLLSVATPSLCFAMMDIDLVSRERAKELGMQIRSKAAGPNDVRVELEFKTGGVLKRYSRVDLEIKEGGRSVLFASLREEQPEPGRVVVSFAADRTKLDGIALRVVTGAGSRDMSGYELRVKDFVDLEKLR